MAVVMQVPHKTLGPTSELISAIGQGGMGVGGYQTADSSNNESHIRALQLGVELGMSFIDTAEVYAAGYSEEVIGTATKGMRDRVFIATKVSTEHLTYNDVLRSAEGSLRRLKTDYLDLYQLHWPNPKIPIEETMHAMERLVKDGKVRYIGVSNFSLKELLAAQAALSNERIVSLQTEYSLSDRTVEGRILPYCETHRMTTIAYSPLDHGRVASGTHRLRRLQEIAQKYNKTCAQLALKWLISHPTVIAIPKATNPEHVRENAAAGDIPISDEDMAAIDRIFMRATITVPTDRMRVVTNPGHPAYCTVEEAKANALGFVPSPMELAADIRAGEFLKPIRLAPTTDSSGRYDYDLIEGRIRYWAWVIAHDGIVPIEAFVRES